MFKSLLNESLELVWLASLVGGLSVVGVGLAIALALWIERLPAVTAHV
jgi:hypothetical protein